MARMLPYPVCAFKTESERKIFDLLQSGLGPEYTVLYGRSWTRSSGNGNPDPECDFIIAKPNGGILVLEVKGGIWERRQGNWYANGDLVGPHDDPFEQGRSNKYALIELLKAARGWHDTFFPVDYAAALPDTTFETMSETYDLPSVLTHSELNYVAEWMESAMADCIQRNREVTCTQAMIEHLIQSVMRDYIVRLRDVLATDEERLYVLTEQQLTLDKALARRKRLTIQGCAGSGKTWMALKQVRRLADKHDINHILFVCFNTELGLWLERMTEPIHHKCETVRFMEYCERYARQFKMLTGKETKDKDYWEHLPYLLLDVIDRLPHKFDAIVVDEGQTFKKDWWTILELLLNDRERSYFYVFYDELQRIYDETSNWVPGDDQPIDLNVNIRNTARIHRQAVKFVPPERLPDCNNVLGEPVEIGLYQDASGMKDSLRKVLHRLISEGRVSSKDIIVLTPKGAERSQIASGRIGPYQLSPVESNDPAAVRYTSVLKFRGMERRVVILTELDEQVHEMERVVYLGASRAKTKLVMLCGNRIPTHLMDRLTEGCRILEN